MTYHSSSSYTGEGEKSPSATKTASRDADVPKKADIQKEKKK